MYTELNLFINFTKYNAIYLYHQNSWNDVLNICFEHILDVSNMFILLFPGVPEGSNETVLS